LDRVFAPLHLERLFLGRHIYYHFRYWYRHQLAGYVKEMLLDPRTLARPHLDRRAVENMVNAHVKGTGNFTSEIHALLTTELMFRELLER
jgi:asparagine synthase (glutamine-hydrolysing)